MDEDGQHAFHDEKLDDFKLPTKLVFMYRPKGNLTVHLGMYHPTTNATL
jgi:hypothetical protein